MAGTDPDALHPLHALSTHAMTEACPESLRIVSWPGDRPQAWDRRRSGRAAPQCDIRRHPWTRDSAHHDLSHPQTSSAAPTATRRNLHRS